MESVDLFWWHDDIKDKWNKRIIETHRDLIENVAFCRRWGFQYKYQYKGLRWKSLYSDYNGVPTIEDERVD